MEITDRPKLTKDTAITRAREHWCRAEHNRSYATAPDVDFGLGAIALSWYEQGGSFANHQPDDAETFTEFLEKLNEAAPEMRLLQREPIAPPKLPELWRDPVTRTPLSNPYEIQDQAARLRATSALGKHDPALLEHFRRINHDPYGYVQELCDKEASALRSKAVKYGADEHRSNPFVKANGATETEKSKFVRTFPDLVETYRREAQPIQMPIGVARNLTIASQVAKHPRLHAIITRADEIIRIWNEEERQRLRTAKAKAEQELKRLGELI